MGIPRENWYQICFVDYLHEILEIMINQDLRQLTNPANGTVEDDFSSIEILYNVRLAWREKSVKW